MARLGRAQPFKPLVRRGLRYPQTFSLVLTEFGASSPSFPLLAVNQTGVGTKSWNAAANIEIGGSGFATVTLISCFIAGTLVRTPSGLIPIESLSVGQKIIAANGVVIEVLAVFVHDAPEHFVLRTESHTVGVTGEHPFLTPDGMRHVSDLKIGDAVITESGIEAVTSKEASVGNVQVYDLSVAEPHTYFADGFAVHNKP